MGLMTARIGAGTTHGASAAAEGGAGAVDEAVAMVWGEEMASAIENVLAPSSCEECKSSFTCFRAKSYC